MEPCSALHKKQFQMTARAELESAALPRTMHRIQQFHRLVPVMIIVISRHQRCRDVRNTTCKSGYLCREFGPSEGSTSPGSYRSSKFAFPGRHKRD